MPLPAFTNTLKSTLVRELRALGIRATVHFKALGQTRVFRVYVVSDEFDAWRYQERQEHVWRIVREHLSQSEQNQISMIVTATMEEIEDDEDAPNPRRKSSRRSHRRG